MTRSGSRVGAYEIASLIGSGGMGEVYRARDTKLGRDVALKFLPAGFTGDPDRMARFTREAQILASLNHPHIAQIYGIEQADGVHFLVLELVDGVALDARIKHGPVPLDEALAIARQIADALEAAHERGIVHRDLKPANIALTNAGQVKVLDFGLARFAEGPGGSGTAGGPGGDLLLTQSPTITSPAKVTGVGVILGTAAYMSPEQARGRAADKRADIWAFGVVLYEMITGRRPFDGDDVGEVLAAVIRAEPSWSDVPPSVRPLLQRCLQKDPAKRLRDISSVSLLMEERAVPVHHQSRLPWAIAAAFAVLSGIAWWAPWRDAPTARPIVRLDIDLGVEGTVEARSSQGPDLIVSPDGTRIAWLSRSRVFTRRLDQTSATELPGTLGASSPFFSPDGQWLAFFAVGKLKKISVDGGAAVTVCDVVAAPRGGAWGDGGRIALSLQNRLVALPDGGGTPVPVTDAGPAGPGDALQRWPQFLPGSDAVLFTNRTGSSFDEANIEVIGLRNGSRKIVQRGGTFGRYVPSTDRDGFLLYVTRGTMFAVRFDAARLETRGTPTPVLQDVAYNALYGSAQFDVSRTGALVYRSGSESGMVTLAWVDGGGAPQKLPAKPGLYAYPVLSPDGNRVALSVTGPGGQDIWVYDLRRDYMARLTYGGGSYVFPVWSPDGRYVVFTGGFGGHGIYWTRADGAATPQFLTKSAFGQFPWSFSPDGKRLAYAEFPTGAGDGDLWTVPIENTDAGLKAGQPELFLRTLANELYPAFSPDGRWIAYRTFESGRSEIEVRAFPDNGGKWLVSNDGGAVPIWSPNGRELFYRTEDQQLMVVPYTVQGGVFVPEKPTSWLDKRLLVDVLGRNLDIAPDGKRFIAVTPVEPAANQKLTFVENFVEEIRRRVAAANAAR